MLYETTARASEIVAINVEDLDLEQRRAPVRSKGGDSCTSVRWRAATEPERPDLERDNYGWHHPTPAHNGGYLRTGDPRSKR
jgi:hypothetical protein